MEFYSILGFIGALLIGGTLGLIGGGGSILTVPVLVYLLDMDPVRATGYSLFIVGLTSAFGAGRYISMDRCRIKAGLFFAIPSMLAVFLTRRYLIPALPEEIFRIGEIPVDKGMFLMTLFALLMIGTSWSMIRGFGKGENAPDREGTGAMILLMAGGAAVGVLAGLVGAGGGFLIVPALILLARLAMKDAVGTSLFVISIQSLIGFLGELGQEGPAIEFGFLFVFSGIAVIGALLGVYLTRYIRNERLKPIFGIFVLLMAIGILIGEWSGASF
jgi:uncharacterized membrane protein YfcA